VAVGAGRIPVCLGFDGSDTSDHTAIKAETIDGLLFTPHYGDDRPTIWNPDEWGGRIPRSEVHAAVDHVFRTYAVERLYGDPPGWQTELDMWALEYGEKVVIQWPTYRAVQMHAACERFVTDLTSGALTHDGCPITNLHVGNARKLAKPGDRYILGKPSQSQKIDAAVTSVLAHEAAADARLAGWGKPEPSRRVMVLR
jgi:hypothetical protein